MTQESPFFIRAFRTPVDPERLRSVRESIIQHALQAGLEKERAWDLASVADELLCNVDEHSGAAWMELSLERGPEGIRMRLNDDGREFDLKGAMQAAGEPSGRRDRGLGLFVVRQLVKSVERRRMADGANETLLHF
jgi:anti-sigma regulatory factor (Ser/Thr protein kinase)